MNSMVITGATSSLGTALIDECIRNDIKVLALVRKDSPNLDRITKDARVKVVFCALDEMADFKPSDEKYDAFVHLAWAGTANAEKRDQIRPQIDNISYALDAVDLAERLGCSVFVGAGSQAEYGRTNEVLTEETPTRPETAYGAAKLCAGGMTRMACKAKGIRHIWSRILSSYGPKYVPQTVINYTINELLAGRKPVLTAGEQIWDFLYNEDVARALYLLAKDGKDGELYVVGSGISHPLREYLETIRDLIDPTLELGLGEREYSDREVMHLACDITKIREDVGFSPQVSFEEGIMRTIRWNREHYHG